MNKFFTLLLFVGQFICYILSKCLFGFKKRDTDLWVFGEWFGNRCCDNCLYFANYLANKYPNLKLVWITCPGTNTSQLYSTVLRVDMDSKDAIKKLKSAGVVMFVQGMEDVTHKKLVYYSGAMVINMWHGVPWKKIGTDGRTRKLNYYYTKMYYKMFGAKYFLSISDEMTNIVSRAYEIKKSRCIRSGYPRNSLFYTQEKEKFRKKVIDYISNTYNYSIPNSSHLVVYMPTFRDGKKEIFSFNNILNDENVKFLRYNNIVILQKVHYVTSKRLGEKTENNYGRVFNIGGEFLSQELLAAADILVTDYSSCFFDFLLLNRPIIHFLYDYNFYISEDRGLYYDKTDIACGDIIEDENELLVAIKENLDNSNKNIELRQERIKKYMKYEDPNTCHYLYSEICKILSQNG